MLHITNGESTRMGLEPSGVPGDCVSWDDVLYEGPTPLAAGEEWLRTRVRYLASAGYGSEEDMLRDFRVKGDPLDAAARHDEVVFWLEHDLHCQLLLVHHLWWLSVHPPTARTSIVMGPEHLGLLKPEEFPARFAARRAITVAEIQAGAAAWTAFCGDDPGKLVAFADLPPEGGSYLAEGVSHLANDVERLLPSLPPAMRRLLEELPAEGTGLARSERQILEVLSEGDRSPEQTFVAAARREEDIWMGDWSFWTIVKRLAAGPHPLLTADVHDVPGRLPDVTLRITDDGRRVLAGRADHLALNAPSRWLGGTWLAPERPWRWTGSSVRPPSP